ncbi:MAG: hypothetical protein R3C18_09465 [Planctomycetaceae bacterium]
MNRVLCILVGFVVLAGLFATQNCVADDAVPKSKTIRVLVLNFDPVVESEQKRLHEVCGWFDPRQLAEGYASDVKKSSGGFINYEIVKWLDVEDFPVKQDGFRYSTETYLACRAGQEKWHAPDLADYPRLAEQYGVVDLVDADKVDELWIFGGPYFGFHESAMMGPGAFYINGGVYNRVGSRRAFAVMGFNYERGVAEMLHNLCHRTESTMTRVYGGWKAEELSSNWSRFAANVKQSGMAGVGSCHYPPNAESDYDYGNKHEVESTADDWLNYPELTGRTALVSCETWGGPDYHRNYMKWWFQHLPHADGINPADGKLNNWWRYVFELDLLSEAQ